MNERERQELLQATAAEIVDGLPAWDGESPAVLVIFTDPVTRRRLCHWFTPAVPAAPESQPETVPGVRRLRLVGEAS